MKLMDFVDYLQTNISARVYPLKFPASSPDTCTLVEFTGGTAPRGTVSTVYVQITARALHPKDGELLGKAIMDFLDKRTNDTIGTKQLIFAAAEQSEPQYIGTDENDRSLFFIHFRLLMG